MYIIEDEAHNKVSEHKNLSTVKRPDGGWSTNVKLGEQIYDESGKVYFIQQVLEPVVGTGPRNLGWGSIEYVDGSWQREKRIGPALPLAPDPTPGDENYYHRDLRKREYIKQLGEDNNFENTVGDILDLMFKEFASLKASGTELTSGMEVALTKISDIKKAFPIPEEDE